MGTNCWSVKVLIQEAVVSPTHTHSPTLPHTNTHTHAPMILIMLAYRECVLYVTKKNPYLKFLCGAQLEVRQPTWQNVHWRETKLFKLTHLHESES